MEKVLGINERIYKENEDRILDEIEEKINKKNMRKREIYERLNIKEI